MLMEFDAYKYETKLSGIDPEINQRGDWLRFKVVSFIYRVCIMSIIIITYSSKT